MDQSQDHDFDPIVPEVCRSCRFGSGAERDCVLIESGRLDRLAAEGPCEIETGLIRVAAEQLVRSGQNPELAEDRKDALLAHLSDRQSILKNLGISRLPEFSTWLESQLSALIEAWLESQPVVAPPEPAIEVRAPDEDPPESRSLNEPEAPVTQAPAPAPARTGAEIRCGACCHFRRDGDGRCGLEYLGADASDLRPNPWWGAAITRNTDPSALEPACDSFTALAPGELDPFQGLISSRPAASRRDEAARLVCLALDRLASRDEVSLRAASVLQAHHFEGLSLAELSARTAVSEGTLQQLITRARADLAEILQAELREGGKPDER